VSCRQLLLACLDPCQNARQILTAVNNEFRGVSSAPCMQCVRIWVNSFCHFDLQNWSATFALVLTRACTSLHEHLNFNSSDHNFSNMCG